MQLTYTLLSTLMLASASLAAPEPRAASFTTWACSGCAATSPCDQTPHQDRSSDTCYPLEANQQSLIVDYTVRSSCSVRFYGTTDCTGTNSTYFFDQNRPCRNLPTNTRTSYKVVCT